MKTFLICFVLVVVAFFAGGTLGAHIVSTEKGVSFILR
jgi:hypothetical protein